MTTSVIAKKTPAPTPAPLDELIDSVTRNGYCSGCGLCEAIAPPGHIQMRMSVMGYLRPVVLQKLPADARTQIAKVCPGVTVAHPPGSKRQHPIWGPLLAVQTGHAIDPEIRHMGSSGGVLSALLLHLLTTGKVDFVAQIAASLADPLANELQISHTRQDILRAAGSRYSPSAPLRQLRELLATGKKFAFVGKPCDVAALRQYGEINPDVKRQVPYMVSFMCAGIPSLAGTHEVLKKMGADQAKLTSFRYRGDGWPGMTCAVHANGERFEMDYNSSWGKTLNKHLQFRCKICPDGTGEFADVTCADAWYGKDGHLDFTEREGRSLLIARTAVGQVLVAAAVRTNCIEVATLPVDAVASMQPYQRDRKQVVLGRSFAARLAHGKAPRYLRLGLLRAAFQTKPILWLRSALGTWRRAKSEPQ